MRTLRRGGTAATGRNGRGSASALAALIFFLGLAGLSFAQEAGSEPEPPKAPPLGAGLSAELPGGLDMSRQDRVEERLAAAKQDLQSLPEDDPHRAEKQKLLGMQIEILEGQLALLQARARLEQLEAELTEGRRSQAEGERASTRRALEDLDAGAELGELRGIEDVEVLRRHIEKDFVEPARVHREATARQAERIQQHQSDMAAGESSRASARPALATHQKRLEELRQELQARSDLSEDERKLLERRIAVREQGVFFERSRLEYLDRQADVLARALALLTIEQEANQAKEERARRLEIAAKALLEERLAQRQRDLEAEAARKREEIASASVEHERLFKEEEVESLQLDATLKALWQTRSEVEDASTLVQSQLKEARQQLEAFRETYESLPDAASRPELREVEETLRRLRRQTDRGTFARKIDDLKDRLAEHRDRLEEAEDRLARRPEAFRARMEAAGQAFVASRLAVGESVEEAQATWETREAEKWDEQLDTQMKLLGDSVGELQAIVAQLERRLDATRALHDVCRQTLVLLQRENLFLRGESRISWGALTEGVSDLLELPQASIGLVQRLGAYLTEPSNFSSWITFALVLLFSALLLGSISRALGRRSRRMIDRGLTTLPAKTAVLALRLLRAAMVALFLWLVTNWARWLLPDLGTGMYAWLGGVGEVLAGFWIGRAIVRELLRPRPPERAVIPFDPKSAARLYRAAMFLLVVTVVYLPIQLALVHFGYENPGAIELLDLIYKGVTGLVLLAIVASRETFSGLVPASSLRWVRFLGWLLRTLRPVLILLIPALLIIDVLQYEFLAGFIWRISGFLVAVGLGAYLAYLGGCYVLEGWIRSALGGDDGDEVALRRRNAARSTALFALKLVTIFGAGWVFLAAVGFGLSDVRLLLAIPLPFQAADAENPVTWWHLIVAAVALAVFLPAARHAKVAIGELLTARTRLDAGLRYTITTLVGYLLVGLGIYLSLTQLVNLENLGYVVAALSVGIGFGLQEIISNFVSGIILLFERPLRVGDIIHVGNHEGIVRRIDIRATTLQTRDNLWILVPNKDLVTKEVVNFVYTDPKLRIRITVGVAYGSDTALVRKVLLEVADNDGRVLERPAPDVYFTAFGESSLDFVLLVWVSDSLPKERVSSDLRFAIDASFRRHGIQIPFPQRDLHLVSSRAPMRVEVERIEPNRREEEAPAMDGDEPKPEEPPARRLP